MKKIFTLLFTVALCFLSVFAFGCNDSQTIKVCASDTPHAEVLNGIVKQELAKKGYKLKVTVLDWSIQNDSVANGDYDANYFQHVPYLNEYNGKTQLFASCKVHYEPLGIYYGKAAAGADVTDGKTFEICDDVSNAIRAFQLLEAKGVISKAEEGENFPVSTDGAKLNLSETAKQWKSKNGSVTVTLVAENLLVASMKDYDFALLPCNTAYTGNISSAKRAAVEDDIAQVSGKANVIAARKNDYLQNQAYKAKIDALTEVMLSKEVANYFENKYLGAMICNETTQIDLRNQIA